MMPDITINADKETAGRLRTMARMFPRQVYQGVGRAGSVMRSRMRGSMKGGGGRFGVPVMSPLSTVSRLLRARTTPGGVLSQSYAIQMYRDGRGTFRVGFLSVLRSYAEDLQESEIRTFTKSERFFLHRRLGPDTPTMYVRPMRPVTEPFASEQSGEFSRIVIGACLKAINQAMQRKGY